MDCIRRNLGQSPVGIRSVLSPSARSELRQDQAACHLQFSLSASPTHSSRTHDPPPPLHPENNNTTHTHTPPPPPPHHITHKINQKQSKQTKPYRSVLPNNANRRHTCGLCTTRGIQSSVMSVLCTTCGIQSSVRPVLCIPRGIQSSVTFVLCRTCGIQSFVRPVLCTTCGIKSPAMSELCTTWHSSVCNV